jgi:hypothetical protein
MNINKIETSFNWPRNRSRRVSLQTWMFQLVAIIGLLSCTNSICSAQPLSAALVKISNLGNNDYLHVDSTSSPKYCYANKTGVGSWDTYSKEEYGSNVFALKCVATGTYVSVDSTPQHYLYVGSATTPSNTEKFTLVWGGSNWAMQSVQYGYYVSANTTGAQLSATWSQITTNYEQYSFTQIVDVYTAILAWQNNFPNKYKLANTAKYPACPPYNCSMPQLYIQNEQSVSNGTFSIYEEFRNYDLSSPSPVWNQYTVGTIGDWEVILCLKTIPLAISGYDWVQGIPRCVRYLAPNETINTPTQTVDWYSIGANCATAYVATGPEYSTQAPAFMLDLTNANSQENMGQRWVVDLGYKDGFEFWTLDIGPYNPSAPTTVNISPRYGIVRYHRHDPSNPQTETYSEFSNIQNSWGQYPNRCP